MNGDIHEECGVFGIFEPKPAKVADMVYLGLLALQHRGQESCGIAVCDDGVITAKGSNEAGDVMFACRIERS